MDAESPRIQELRRRVQADPAPFVFAQLAEEYRRIGCFDDAVKCCRAGLARHPDYFSTRLILGRALHEMGHLDEAARELEIVLRSAPTNLAATRQLAEVYHERGDFTPALLQFRRALALAPRDSGLKTMVAVLEGRLETLGDQSPTLVGQAPSVSPPAERTQPADLDAVLAAMGKTDHAPPILTQMLLDHEALAEFPSETAVLVSEDPSDDLAHLEQELRARESVKPATPTLGAGDPSSTHVLAELEAWLAALRSDRR
jgi:tetratricopeptide (TPR) repeat protein